MANKCHASELGHLLWLVCKIVIGTKITYNITTTEYIVSQAIGTVAVGKMGNCRTVATNLGSSLSCRITVRAFSDYVQCASNSQDSRPLGSAETNTAEQIGKQRDTACMWTGYGLQLLNLCEFQSAVYPVECQWGDTRQLAIGVVLKHNLSAKDSPLVFCRGSKECLVVPVLTRCSRGLANNHSQSLPLHSGILAPLLRQSGSTR
ncbi:hypothetical protein BC835DRAFT_1302794 [Cytidiella melzeri]|nr:hypothetical protein BC835DRAFT_1302794 [Cytidiella melzeri]